MRDTGQSDASDRRVRVDVSKYGGGRYTEMYGECIVSVRLAHRLFPRESISNI